ncbi:MAG: hypothetical protein H7833_02080 [Magnetococcus sp. DMHC-1]
MYEKSSGILRMVYEYKNGPSFEEVVSFPINDKKLSHDTERALDQAFRLIFLLSGISYYKAYVPARLRCQAFPLGPAMAGFFQKVYLHGLGEFAFRNQLNLQDRIHFVCDKVQADPPVALNASRCLLVPVGGGKDSIVTLETLRQAGEKMILFALGTHGGVAAPIQDTFAESGLPCLLAKRTIAKNLLELNKLDALNGHIPITAIISSIAVATAILHELNGVVLSNEHSASAPNLSMDGFAVNHQYSKSLDFEIDFSDYIHNYLSPDLAYFSLLRPLAEAEITRRFARLENYHQKFRSCNAAFRQDPGQREKYWCCNCPKCRFVFLALAPFIDREKLVQIFQKNLLDDNSQIAGYNELCGVSAHKPFECVGEIEETVLLMQKLHRMQAWCRDVVVNTVGQATEMNDSDFHGKYHALFQTRHRHRLSDHFMKILD